MAPKTLQGYAFAIKGGEQSRAAYIFCFFTLWKGWRPVFPWLCSVDETPISDLLFFSSTCTSVTWGLWCRRKDIFDQNTVQVFTLLLEHMEIW